MAWLYRNSPLQSMAVLPVKPSAWPGEAEGERTGCWGEDVYFVCSIGLRIGGCKCKIVANVR